MCVSQPLSEPHGNQQSFILSSGTQAESQSAILLLRGDGGLKADQQEEEKEGRRKKEKEGPGGAWRLHGVK